MGLGWEGGAPLGYQTRQMYCLSVSAAYGSALTEILHGGGSGHLGAFDVLLKEKKKDREEEEKKNSLITLPIRLQSYTEKGRGAWVARFGRRGFFAVTNRQRRVCEPTLQSLKSSSPSPPRVPPAACTPPSPTPRVAVPDVCTQRGETPRSTPHPRPSLPPS